LAESSVLMITIGFGLDTLKPFESASAYGRMFTGIDVTKGKLARADYFCVQMQEYLKNFDDPEWKPAPFVKDVVADSGIDI